MYKALSSIKHDGTVFNKGDVLPAMSEQDAKILLDEGVIEKAEATQPEKPVKSEQKPKEETGAEKPSKNWNREKLVAYATEHGISFKEEATKQEIVDAIEAAATSVAGQGGSEQKPKDETPVNA